MFDNIPGKITGNSTWLNNPLNVGIIGRKSDIPYYAKPTQTFGYYRGSPIYGGDLDPDGSGPECQGVGEFPQGEGPIPPPKYDYSGATIIGLGAFAVLVITILLCAK
jgi:hypothetical protein